MQEILVNHFYLKGDGNSVFFRSSLLYMFLDQAGWLAVADGGLIRIVDKRSAVVYRDWKSVDAGQKQWHIRLHI